MKHTIFVAVLVLQGFVGIAAAEPSTRIAWTPETLRFVTNGDVGKGKQLAAGCQACHGADSAGVAAAPYLNGQLATYLYRQLRDYKDGSRQHEVMTALVAGLSDQDMADLAQWYNHEPPVQPAARGANQPDLVVDGDSKRLIPPCRICHGGSGQGEVVDTPRLAGQKAAYLRQTLEAYRSGQRHNDIYHRMRAMSGRLSEQEIDALTQYYSGLK